MGARWSLGLSAQLADRGRSVAARERRSEQRKTRKKRGRRAIRADLSLSLLISRSARNHPVSNGAGCLITAAVQDQQPCRATTRTHTHAHTHTDTHNPLLVLAESSRMITFTVRPKVEGCLLSPESLDDPQARRSRKCEYS